MELKILFILLSYFLGAIPFGLLIGKIFYKVDIREQGSKNPGATNVWRTLGKIPGIFTLALDILKGLIPVLVGKYIFHFDLPFLILVGLATVMGHNWSVFLKGKGGKGVATSCGVSFALIPVHMSLALGVFFVFFLTTKHVSVGSMAAAIALFVLTLIIKTNPLIQITIGLASAMILVKHIPNMKRLKKGKEPKINF